MTKAQERLYSLPEASTPSAKRRERQRERRTAHEALHQCCKACQAKMPLEHLSFDSEVLRLEDILRKEN